MYSQRAVRKVRLAGVRSQKPDRFYPQPCRHLFNDEYTYSKTYQAAAPRGSSRGHAPGLEGGAGKAQLDPEGSGQPPRANPGAHPDNRLVEVSEIKGLPEEARAPGSKALAVQRFDRVPGGDPVHMEDFAQVFGQFPNDKYRFHSYANIASVLWAEAGEEAIVEFVRRLVFSVVIGNADMHLKNWSLLYPDRRKPTLSPGYDFVATLPYIPNDKLALSFGGSRSLSEITPGQMRRFADTARIPASPLWKIAVETAERAATAWKGLEQADLLPKDQRASIGKQILAVAATVK